MAKKILARFDENRTNKQEIDYIAQMLFKWWTTDEMPILILPDYVSVTMVDTETGETTNLDDMFEKWHENEKTKTGKLEVV